MSRTKMVSLRSPAELLESIDALAGPGDRTWFILEAASALAFRFRAHARGTSASWRRPALTLSRSACSTRMRQASQSSSRSKSASGWPSRPSSPSRCPYWRRVRTSAPTFPHISAGLPASCPRQTSLPVSGQIGPPSGQTDTPGRLSAAGASPAQVAEPICITAPVVSGSGETEILQRVLIDTEADFPELVEVLVLPQRVTITDCEVFTNRVMVNGRRACRSRSSAYPVNSSAIWWFSTARSAPVFTHSRTS